MIRYIIQITATYTTPFYKLDEDGRQLSTLIVKCDRCEMEFDSEANLKNYIKACGGAIASNRSLRKCDNGSREYAAVAALARTTNRSHAST